MNFSKRFASFAAVLLIGCVVACAHADAQKLSESIKKVSTSQTVRKKAASSKSGTAKSSSAKSGTAKSGTAKTGTARTATSSQKYSQKARTQDSSKSERILETVNNTQIVIVDENDEEISPNTTAKEEQIFTAVEQQAMFPGGEAALMKWLSSNIHYPETAAANDIQGRVVVKFVIEKDGSISNVTIARGVDADLDKEAIRVVKKMPKWNPAKIKGQAVSCYFNLPVKFQLAER